MNKKIILACLLSFSSMTLFCAEELPIGKMEIFRNRLSESCDKNFPDPKKELKKERKLSSIEEGSQAKRRNMTQDDDENMGVSSGDEETEQLNWPSSLTKKEDGCEGELKQAIEFLNGLSEQVKKLLSWPLFELKSGMDLVIFSNMLKERGKKEIGDELGKLGVNICFWESRIKVLKKQLK